VILRTRPAKSAAKYASIWTEQGSPLLHWSARQAELLQAELAQRGHAVLVRHAMRYGAPSLGSVLDGLQADGATRVLVLPLYPQYAAATTASTFDAVAAWAQRSRRMPELRFVNRYHDDAGYIRALAASVRAHWALHGRGQKLVMSFHGVPARSLTLGDPYHCECHKTARLLAEALGIGSRRLHRHLPEPAGPAKWLEPYTEPTVKLLAEQGIKRIDAICPGFAADNLETLEEIAMEAKEAFIHAGGERFDFIDCLNDRPDWIGALADLSLQHLQGWPLGAVPPMHPAPAGAGDGGGRLIRRPPRAAASAPPAPAAAPAPQRSPPAGTTTSGAAGTRPSGPRRWTAHCASAPRPAGPGSCPRPPARWGSL
jgi:ferrochelatase